MLSWSVDTLYDRRELHCVGLVWCHFEVESLLSGVTATSKVDSPNTGSEGNCGFARSFRKLLISLTDFDRKYQQSKNPKTK